MYALGAAGERGVDRVLELFADGLARTMALCGVSDLGGLTRDIVS
ncbi:MAG: alpha-hydroxy-acid oxidizing protein [Acidimicrobiales bacterium]